MQISPQSSLQSGYHANGAKFHALDLFVIAIRYGDRPLLLLLA